jgi:hypothetical protein
VSDAPPAERVLSGASWKEFCRALEQAGDVVLGPGSPADAFERAEGFRYLSRLARGALEAFVEFADPLHPVLRRPAHETLKIGADNPDNRYEAAPVSGVHEYLLSGTRGSVHYLGFGTYAGHYGSKARSGQTGYVDARDLEIGADGRFELRLSRESRPGNWLPMEEDTATLIVRQTFLDRAREQPAQLSLTRIGADGPPAPLSPEALDRGLGAAGAWVAGTASLFAAWAGEFAKRPNELPRFDPARAGAAHGDPNIVYFHGYWELEDDEALVIDLRPPACEYWNFQLNNWWMESLDYRHHRIALNHHEARPAADGRVRLVIAQRDPGAANWLDPAGHRRGTMCLRYVGAREHPEPTCRVMRAGDAGGD